MFVYRSPDGIYLKQLIPEQGEKINDLWPHKHNGSLYFIQRLIEMNMNIGAFTREDDELIAWCLRYVRTIPSGSNRLVDGRKIFTYFISLFSSIESKWVRLDHCRSTRDSNVGVSDHWLSSWCQSDWRNKTKTSPLESLTITSSLDKCSRSSASNILTTHIGSRFLLKSHTSDGSTKPSGFETTYVGYDLCLVHFSFYISRRKSCFSLVSRTSV